MTADLSPTGGRDVHTVRFPVATPPSEVDVLVVGAGPNGLGAAVELTAHGVQVAVVDRAREATLVRAGAMGHSPRTVEHFRRWGLLQAIRDEWTFPPEWNQGIRFVTSLVGHDLARNPRPPFAAAPGAPRPGGAAEGIRRPQTVLQKVFLGHLGRHGVSVAGGWRVEALTEDADGVTVEVADIDSGDRRSVRTRYVIGADGGSSSVRALAGIEREGERATEKRLRLIIRTGDISDRVGPAPSGVNIVVNAKADGFLAAVSNREWRIYGGPYPLDYEPSEDELIEIGRAAFGFDLDLEVASATTYYAASRIASTFRRGRVLLLGDAAHVRTPGGNLGEGFGDIANLGWKLAAVLRGHGGEALLDSYDAERRRHNWRIADDALESYRRGQAGLAQIRRGGIPDDADLSPAAAARRAEIATLLGGGFGGRGGLTFDERYDASPVVWYEPGQLADEPPWEPGRYTDDPRPGHRAPNGEVDPYGSTLYDRVGNSLALLVIGDTTGIDRSVERALAAEAASRGLPLTVVHLSEPSLRAVYGDGTVLVRPDQHVAWRGTELPEGGAVAVLDHVLGIRQAAEVEVPEVGPVTLTDRSATVSNHLDFAAPDGLRVRGTVLVVPGRGETSATYRRFGARIATDSYTVRVLASPAVTTSAGDALARLDAALSAALASLTGGLVRPLVLVGADTGATTLAALVARGAVSGRADLPVWWPDALVLASPPGPGGHEVGGDWDTELDVRSQCPVHRGVLSDDVAFNRGALSAAVDDELLDLAYGSTADIPQLLLVGDSDPLADRQAIDRAAKALPSARLSVVRDAHHDVLNDLQHRSVAAEVVSFLEVVRGGRPLTSIVSTELSGW